MTVRPLAALTLLLLSLATCSRAAVDVPVPAKLAAPAASFRREVLTVVEGVHVAVGFGLANVIRLDGPEGSVIVDTLESVDAAHAARLALEARAGARPVRAIIYTHHHADHVFGAGVFAGATRPAVHAHVSALRELDRLLSLTRPAIYRRSMRQFGALLPPGAMPHAGIGPRLAYAAGREVALLRPTHTFDGERWRGRLAGLELELIHIPGETDDQIAIWLPARRVLLPADDIYAAFPNLYTIRGSAPRDALAWAASLDRLRALRPLHLVPGHGRPLHGEAVIAETLRSYRDAIRLVHDQTVRWMNRGLGPDEIVQRVRLPPHLAAHPWLQQVYGTVAWSVRGIFDGYLGWFDGDAAHLEPLAPRERARRMALLVGGPGALLARARDALHAQDQQWALELLAHLLVLDPTAREARTLRARALRGLAARQLNANARGYYLTQALEAEGVLTIGDPRREGRAMLSAVPLRAVLEALTVTLDAERAAAVEERVAFVFPDAGESFTVEVRRGVADVRAGREADAPLTVTLSAELFRDIVTETGSPLRAYLSGRLRVQGGALRLVRFMRLFRPD